VEAEDSYMYGEGRKGREGGGILLLGMDRQEVWWRRGVFPWIFLWFGRLDVYVARFPVGVPNLLRGGNGGAA